ncbi:hypothetical protein AncyloWKF20_12705 [Ancylobacter sp. WKF20]|uniref:hypothetical protein n=1 Tax=Ancylobacter sp. WKF20 TaxID=3039801 RepID=UPI0024341886|nr:hypothetical protein [Ancylobacter sp. WKF20]WGD28665.1 hypothetical protein AncyloWKF20_12705 [Ancylobacter sp. WKF20]
MRHTWSSLTAFQAWLPGRVLLPAGFAVLVAVSIYLVGDGRGYERAISEAVAPKNAAQVVTTDPVDDLSAANLAKTDRLDIPVLLRAIEPEAVYKPPQAHAAAAKPAKSVAATEIPAGVERFDQCGAGCETRDPMIVRTSYPVGPAATPFVAAPTAEPAPKPEEAGILGLPPLPGPGEIVDRTVKGTTAAYDAVKDGAVSTYDTVKGALGEAFGLTR